jgi:hypothetical protein
MHNMIYRAWPTTSDYRRSALRWAIFMDIVMVLFAWLYTPVSVGFGPNQTWLSSLYFSIITPTTLGHGDVIPSCAAAQAIVRAYLPVNPFSYC